MFDSYWNRIEAALKCQDLGHKSACIELSNNPLPREVVSGLVEALFRTMASETRSSTSKSNWTWREKDVPASDRQKEVWVERHVCSIGNKVGGNRHGSNKVERPWTYQMPVASGVGGSSRSRRRSIDLVHRSKARHFEFIELKWDTGERDKWGADNPVYAAFEIVGYALAYLSARKDLGDGNPAMAAAGEDVFRARRIDLKVVAPAGYYTYRRSRRSAAVRYNLAWLEHGINKGLATVSAGDPTMTFAFCRVRPFDRGADARKMAARDIAAGRYASIFKDA